VQSISVVIYYSMPCNSIALAMSDFPDCHLDLPLGNN